MNILEKYSNCCSVCKRFKPTLPKPAVVNLFDPDKIRFNQVVSIDLKQYRKNGFYLIDVVTRYIRVAFFGNNCKETIVSIIIQLWGSIFGGS